MCADLFVRLARLVTAQDADGAEEFYGKTDSEDFENAVSEVLCGLCGSIFTLGV